MNPNTLPGMIPLFALPSTILFPGTFVPLHVFEPRYREMVRDSLEGDRLIGMVLLKENWEKNYYGNPPIHPIGCAGRMVQVQRLEDGRYNIILQGLEKFNVNEEVFTKSYRQGWVKSFGDVPPPCLPVSLRNDLISALNRFARHRGWENPANTILSLQMDDDRLVQVLSLELDLTPLERQFLLESEHLVQQCRRLIDLIGFMTAGGSSTRKINRPHDAENP